MKYYDIWGKLVSIDDAVVTDYEKMFCRVMSDKDLHDILLLHYKEEERLKNARSSDLATVCSSVLDNILYEAKDRVLKSDLPIVDDTEMLEELEVEMNKTSEQLREEAEEYRRIVSFVNNYLPPNTTLFAR